MKVLIRRMWSAVYRAATALRDIAWRRGEIWNQNPVGDTTATTAFYDFSYLEGEPTEPMTVTVSMSELPAEWTMTGAPTWGTWSCSGGDIKWSWDPSDDSEE
jgi:hypothetical protein